jgi:lysine 2,3-aminomutase
VEELWRSDQELLKVLEASDGVEDARNRISETLRDREAWLNSRGTGIDELERINALQCIRVLRNFIAPKNEELTGVSFVSIILDLLHGDMTGISVAFVVEVRRLLEGSLGRSGIYRDPSLDFLKYEGREAASMRSNYLDDVANGCLERMRSFPTGLDSDIIIRREGNRDRILEKMGGKEDDWGDYRWQLRNVIRSLDPLQELIELTPEEKEAVEIAVENGIPFGITPYYLSLMDREPSRVNDHAVRAQVIPPLSYVKEMVAHREDREYAFDFMREHDTSPEDLITRRYPMIAIMKPYNTCAQICVYCQRNWEIDEVLSPNAMASDSDLDKAVSWFQEHPTVNEVLVTGGDPAILSDQALDRILGRLAELDHVERLRLGTRTPVVLPMRFSDEFVDILDSYHELPGREVCLVSHYEHTYEVTPESMEAIQKIRRRGMGAYNQQVFTFENSRRFETAALRVALKRIGVDPYYTFNAKGKGETAHYRVPIARLLQERKEEARLLPGIVRTDEPVFNIPAMGKNHLRAAQHHDYIMLSPEGERHYHFHPWEKKIHLADTYVYKDVPIFDYLRRLDAIGEDVSEYDNIWYYF